MAAHSKTLKVTKIVVLGGGLLAGGGFATYAAYARTPDGVIPNKVRVAETVIDLAHNFGSAAVAIGIEKASDALALTSMGCDLGQGFLLGQPMPQERFMSLLRQRTAGQIRVATTPR